MKKVSGGLYLLQLGLTAESLVGLGCTTSGAFSRQVNTEDIICKESASGGNLPFSEPTPTSVSATLSTDALIIIDDTDPVANTTNISLYDGYMKQGTILYFSYGPTDPGSEIVTGRLVITSISDTTGSSESAKWTIETSVYGDWTYENVPTP